MPDLELRLKVNTIVSLLIDLSGIDNLIKGTRLVVTGLFKHNIRVSHLTGIYI